MVKIIMVGLRAVMEVKKRIILALPRFRRGLGVFLGWPISLLLLPRLKSSSMWAASGPLPLPIRSASTLGTSRLEPYVARRATEAANAAARSFAPVARDRVLLSYIGELL